MTLRRYRLGNWLRLRFLDPLRLFDWLDHNLLQFLPNVHGWLLTSLASTISRP